MTNASENLIHVAIDSAEELHDPLEDLPARTKADPGAPFVMEVLEALVALRREDRAQFEGLRAQLKHVGCRITALDEVLDEEAGDDGKRRPKQADLLIELTQKAELFHSPDATAFADLMVNGHRETCRSVPKASVVGWPGAFSRRQVVRRTPKPCSRRSMSLRPRPTSMGPSGRSTSVSVDWQTDSISILVMRLGGP